MTIKKNDVVRFTDVADRMAMVCGLIRTLEHVGDTHSIIDPDALSYTFRVIDELVQEAREFLYVMDELPEAVEKKEAVPV